MSNFAITGQKIGAIYLPESSNTGCYRVDTLGVTKIEERYEPITDDHAIVMFDVFSGDNLIASVNSTYVSSVTYLSH